MAEFIAPFTFPELDYFTRGYLEAAQFTDCHADNPELEDCDGFGPSALTEAARDCAAFQKAAERLLYLAYERDYDEEQAGRDFWFTRNGHGAGFWDREELEADDLGDDLSALCGWKTSFGEVNVYAGDDNLLYFG